MYSSSWTDFPIGVQAWRRYCPHRRFNGSFWCSSQPRCSLEKAPHLSDVAKCATISYHCSRLISTVGGCLPSDTTGTGLFTPHRNFIILCCICTHFLLFWPISFHTYWQVLIQPFLIWRQTLPKKPLNMGQTLLGFWFDSYIWAVLVRPVANTSRLYISRPFSNPLLWWTPQ